MPRRRLARSVLQLINKNRESDFAESGAPHREGISSRALAMSMSFVHRLRAGAVSLHCCHVRRASGRASSASDTEHFYTLMWHRGKLFFAAGFFFGGGGLSGAAALRWNQDAAQPPEDDRNKASNAIGERSDDVSLCAGRLQRRVGSWWPRWEPTEAELRQCLLLLRRVEPNTEPSGAVSSFAEGPRCSALPLKGANVEEPMAAPHPTGARAGRRERARRDPPSSEEEQRTISLTTTAGDMETLRLPTAEAHRRWTQALRAEAHGQPGVGRGRFVDVDFPPTWQRPYERAQVVPLDKASAEYQRVEKLALSQQLKSSGTYVKGKLVIRGISRVQAPHVWEQYAMRRAIIASENGGDPMERMLWHGTCVPHVITKEGFDPRVCNLSGMFGGGIDRQHVSNARPPRGLIHSILA